MTSGESKLVFNITYHPAFANIKDILNRIHLLLTPDKDHQNVFPHVPVVGFKRGKSLQDHLVRAKVSPPECEGLSKPCGKKRCQVCKCIKEADTFSNADNTEVYKIRTRTLDCDSSNIVYLVQCKTCNKQYVGSTVTPFRLRYNNYKSCCKKHSQNISVPQMSFHDHFAQKDHNGMDDWSFKLIDHASDANSLRRRESFWQHKLKTFHPLGLNERDVAFEMG